MKKTIVLLGLTLFAAQAAHATDPQAVAANARGVDAMSQGNFKAAIGYFSQALTTQDDPTIFANRGVAYRETGDVRRALADFSKALELRPGYLYALTSRAGTYYGLRQYDKAIDDITTALNIDLRNAPAFDLRGLVYQAKGDHEQAISDFTKAINIGHGVSPYRVHRGVSYFFKEDWNRAMEDFNSAIEISPTNGYAYAWRARTALERRQLSRALADSERAIELNPLNDEAYYARGRVFHAQGQFAKAIADYEKTLLLDPNAFSVALLLGLAKRNEPLPGFTPPDTSEPPTPNEGEIRLMGTVQSIDAAQSKLVLDVALFTLPNGKTSRLEKSKPKTVRVAPQCSVFPFTGFARSGTLADIQAGAQAFVIGRDAGSGQELPARWLGALQRAPEVKPAEAPQLPANVVGRPQFTRRDGTKWTAGTAFFAQLDNGTALLLTALHLLGTSGGLREDIAPEKVGEEIQDVQLTRIDGGANLGTAQGALLRDGFTLTERPRDYSGDLAAFRLPAQNGAALLTLAKDAPVHGDTIWIAGRATSEKSPVAGALLYPAHVVVSEEKRLVAHPLGKVSGRAFSGAPALNARGEVVGMMLGSFDSEGTTVFLLNPATAMRARLTERSSQPQTAN